MGNYYPVYLDLTGRPCVVIGGGREAERKVAGLLEAGAKVTLINAEVSVVLKDMAGRGLIDWVSRDYQTGDLEGAFLAIVENDRPRVYQAVAREAEKRGILLNVVDTTHLCSFIAPAIVRRGEVTFAISTGGLSPALARRLREELDASPVMRWAEMADLFAEVRREVRKKGLRPHPDRWQECMDGELMDLYFGGRREEAKARLLSMLQEQPEPTRAAGVASGS
ncbi:MAG: bifunctional precorrin-2 dehydrogenase/sirohydrochlorin ferrochelatase [Chloroflexi bacterium]|nr:bifunctional precorrin-2 dehydrogenase/sirohydrochlorin ferrochelatase [Chloroflexota bacterium]